MIWADFIQDVGLYKPIIGHLLEVDLYIVLTQSIGVTWMLTVNVSLEDCFFPMKTVILNLFMCNVKENSGLLFKTKQNKTEK